VLAAQRGAIFSVLSATVRRRARLSTALTCALVSLAGRGRVGGLGQQLEGVGGVELVVGLQRRGEVLSERGT
jgi:hypothetical protein